MTSQSIFRVLDSAIESDVAEWIRLWEEWPEREVFAHPAYLSLFGAEGVARCAVYQANAGTVLYPFILRDVAATTPGLVARDTTTPYGYGGAVHYGANSGELAEKFWEQYDAWAISASIVSEFVRFNLDQRCLLRYPGDVIFKQNNIVCDLTASADELWAGFDHKVRKNVKKALRLDVVVEVDLAGSRFDEFFAIYESTMDRRDASKGYYFERAFFEAIHENLPGQFVYFHAVHGGEVVSTELVLASSENLYSFLGGTKSEFFDLRPNDLLKHQVMLWGIANGKRKFVLGGGFQPDDGIYRYKKSFAPNGVVPFSVGNRVLNPERYAELASDAQSTALIPPYFPAYRQ